MKRERLERYLDGLSTPAEERELERELARDPALAAEVALQRRIDAALGRRFAPPARLAAPLAAPPRGARPPRLAWLACAAALLAALGAGFAWLRRERTGGEQLAALAPAASGGALAGAAPAPPSGVPPRGLERVVVEPGRRDVEVAAAGLGSLPNAELIYRRLSSPGGPLSPAAPPPSTPLDLSSALAQRYDACFDLGAPACSLLGPYAAPEWPSATVLVGFCDGAGRAPSLLVVDDQTMRGCALAPDMGELRPFYKEVNGLAVWEISPRGEPLLLDAVRSCRD